MCISTWNHLKHLCDQPHLSEWRYEQNKHCNSNKPTTCSGQSDDWWVCSNEIFIRKSGTLLSWLIRAARWAWPLGWGMDLCESEPVGGETLTRQAHTFTPFSQLAQTYLPTVMWKFPATLLTNRYPCILQAVSEAEPSSLRPEGAGEQSHTMQDS